MLQISDRHPDQLHTINVSFGTLLHRQIWAESQPCGQREVSSPCCLLEILFDFLLRFQSVAVVDEQLAHGVRRVKDWLDRSYLVAHELALVPFFFFCDFLLRQYLRVFLHSRVHLSNVFFRKLELLKDSGHLFPSSSLTTRRKDGVLQD